MAEHSASLADTKPEDLLKELDFVHRFNDNEIQYICLFFLKV